MRYVLMVLVAWSVSVSSPAAVSATVQACNETKIGAFLCGDDCYIWDQNSHCVYQAYYLQCWYEEEWVESYLCMDGPCYIQGATPWLSGL